MEHAVRQLDVAISVMNAAFTMTDDHDTGNLITSAESHIKAARALVEAALNDAVKPLPRRG
jgi:hypothetical protein